MLTATLCFVCITGLLDPLSTELYGDSSLPLVILCHSTYQAHFQKALERHPTTDQLIRACDAGRPQNNHCALLRTLLLSSLLGMDTNPNARSSPSASSS